MNFHGFGWLWRTKLEQPQLQPGRFIVFTKPPAIQNLSAKAGRVIQVQFWISSNQKINNSAVSEHCIFPSQLRAFLRHESRVTQLSCQQYKKIKNDKDLGWCKPTKNMHTKHMKDTLILKFITSQKSFDLEKSSLLKDPLILKVHQLIRKDPLISKELLIIGGAMVVCGRKSGWCGGSSCAL